MKLVTVALSMAALIGCGTAQKAPDGAADSPGKEEQAEIGTGGRAARGAAGGAVAGALMCLGIAPAGLPAGGIGVIGSTLAALVCLPVGVVVGAATGGVVAARSTSARTATASARPGGEGAARSGSSQTPAYENRGAFLLAASGRLPLGVALPSGDLYVAMNTIAATAGDRKRASLIVDFDDASSEGEKSLIAHAVIACDKPSATIRRSFTHAGRFGEGSVIHSLEHVPPMAIEVPGPALSEAIRTVCDAGPWWNTPAQLYGE